MLSIQSILLVCSLLACIVNAQSASTRRLFYGDSDSNCSLSSAVLQGFGCSKTRVNEWYVRYRNVESIQSRGESLITFYKDSACSNVVGVKKLLENFDECTQINPVDQADPMLYLGKKLCFDAALKLSDGCQKIGTRRCYGGFKTCHLFIKADKPICDQNKQIKVSFWDRAFERSRCSGKPKVSIDVKEQCLDFPGSDFKYWASVNCGSKPVYGWLQNEDKPGNPLSDIPESTDAVPTFKVYHGTSSVNCQSAYSELKGQECTTLGNTEVSVRAAKPYKPDEKIDLLDVMVFRKPNCQSYAGVFNLSQSSSKCSDLRVNDTRRLKIKSGEKGCFNTPEDSDSCHLIDTYKRFLKLKTYYIYMSPSSTVCNSNGTVETKVWKQFFKGSKCSGKPSESMTLSNSCSVLSSSDKQLKKLYASVSCPDSPLYGFFTPGNVVAPTIPNWDSGTTVYLRYGATQNECEMEATPISTGQCSKKIFNSWYAKIDKVSSKTIMDFFSDSDCTIPTNTMEMNLDEPKCNEISPRNDKQGAFYGYLLSSLDVDTSENAISAASAKKIVGSLMLVLIYFFI